MADKLVVCCSSMEDQDSSGESGLGSNWWVLGSQGRDPLSATGDATLQTLSQFALSSFGTQSTQSIESSEHENAINKKITEKSRCDSRKIACDEQQSDKQQSNLKDAPSERSQSKEREKKWEHKQYEQNKNTSNDKGNTIAFIPCNFRCISFILRRI